MGNYENLNFNRDHTMNKFKKSGIVKTVKGSVLTPINSDLGLILAVNSMSGKNNDPLFTILSKRWVKVKEDSRDWFVNKTGEYKLGAVKNTAVQSNVWVSQMLCLDKNNNIDISGLENCIKNVMKTAVNEQASVHVSNVLTNNIPELKNLLSKHLVDNGINVFIYE